MLFLSRASGAVKQRTKLNLVKISKQKVQEASMLNKES